jgi:hypothetical protein
MCPASNRSPWRAETEQEPEGAARLPRDDGADRAPPSLAIATGALDVTEAIVRGVGGVQQLLQRSPVDVYGTRIRRVEHAAHGRQ